jgi:NAD(P)-dependent dehydrogenase (short-subunit alcohol dehydrogenase family)
VNIYIAKPPSMASPSSSSTPTPPVTTIQLKDKIIAITGANRGIGLGIASSCLSNGAARVYSLDIGSPGDDFAAVQAAYPDRLFALPADVTKEDSIQGAVDAVLADAGALHGMVCNAGRTKHKPALEFTTEEIDQLWGVNVSSLCVCVWREWGGMGWERKGGVENEADGGSKTSCMGVSTLHGVRRAHS